MNQNCKWNHIKAKQFMQQWTVTSSRIAELHDRLNNWNAFLRKKYKLKISIDTWDFRHDIEETCV
jgi:hypothetical protein